MVLTEVLHQISACDTQKPYIFISYSSQDHELVWQDVLKFQRMGYNIWLDERNLDKTKASWKEDALTAIEDMYCMLVVFYVSKSSLLSDACYRELSKTTDEFTTALHYGPVKFIAVDVDEIGNIIDFTRDLHQSVVQNPELSKDAKSKMLITLHQFMKDFFGSNNEKVRVHPKNEPNRKMNYYEEIVASFPDAAKNQPCPVADNENASAIEEEKYVQVEQKLFAEAKARRAAEAEAQQLKQLMMEMEQAADPGQPNSSFTQKQICFAIAQANSENLSSSHILCAEEISESKLRNALNAYAKTVKPEDVLGLIDCTLFGSAKEGCIITQNGIYSESFKGRPILFADIASYAVAESSYHVDITYKDSTKQRFFISSTRQKMLLPLLDAILKLK